MSNMTNIMLVIPKNPPFSNQDVQKKKKYVEKINKYR
jgi:hypothetical protein